MILLLHGATARYIKHGGPPSLDILPGMVTYVLGDSGKVQDIFVSRVQSERHVANVLAVVKKIVEEA